LVFSYNLRFPGQYYDAETGKHYNYYRDYDPNVGRYIESDPTGLKGGYNTYAYGLLNSLVFVDPDGRFARNRDDRGRGRDERGGPIRPPLPEPDPAPPSPQDRCYSKCLNDDAKLCGLGTAGACGLICSPLAFGGPAYIAAAVVCIAVLAPSCFEVSKHRCQAKCASK